MAGALLEMIEAGVLLRDAGAMPRWHGRTPRAYRHGRGRWRGWPPRVRGRVRLRRCGVEGEALCCLCVRPARAGLDSPHPRRVIYPRHRASVTTLRNFSHRSAVTRCPRTCVRRSLSRRR